MKYHDNKGVNKMKKATLASLLSLMLGFFIVISLSTTSFAEKEELQEIEGNILCVDRDSDGNIIVDEKYTECNGVHVVVSSNGNIYTLTGSKEDIKTQYAKIKEKNQVNGKVSGNQRAWLIDVSRSDSGEVEKSESKTIKGDIYCLLPNPYKLSAKALLSSNSCNELPPHSHVISTREGAVYSVVGPEKKIVEIEKNPKNDVLLKGKLRYNESGIVLYAF